VLWKITIIINNPSRHAGAVGRASNPELAMPKDMLLKQRHGLHPNNPNMD